MNSSYDRHFHARIQQQTSLESAGQVLAECAETLGWDLVAFHANKDATSLPRARNGEYIARRMGWPAACLEGWSKRELGLNCPVAQRCGTAVDPFLWSTAAERSDLHWKTPLTSKQREVMNYYGEYMRGCVTVPVRLNGRRIGYVSWCSSKHDDVEHRYHETYSSVYLLSHTFIRHSEQLARPMPQVEDRSGLTVRERECLTWAARGKSEEEIGMILQRSRETVHFHLRNAVSKLHAGNRTHAVAIACTRGIITPFEPSTSI